MKTAANITLLIVFSPVILAGLLFGLSCVAWRIGYGLAEDLNDYIS